MDSKSLQLHRIKSRIEVSCEALESLIQFAKDITSYLAPYIQCDDTFAIATHHAIQAWHCSLESELIANRDAFEICRLAERLENNIPEQLQHRMFSVLSPWFAAIEDEANSSKGYGRSVPGLVPSSLCEWSKSLFMPVIEDGWQGSRVYCENILNSIDSILLRTPFPQSMGHALTLARSDLLRMREMLCEQESMLFLYTIVKETIESLRIETNENALSILTLEMIELQDRMKQFPRNDLEFESGEEE